MKLSTAEPMAPPHAAAATPEPGEPRFSFARIDWAALLKRIYDVDSLACSCGGHLRFISLILDAGTAQGILKSLGLPSQPPPVARARAPDLRDPLPPEP